MSGGVRGDHPYTDIMFHRSSAGFGREIADLVRAVSHKHGDAKVVATISEILWELSIAGKAADQHVRAEVISALHDLDARASED